MDQPNDNASTDPFATMAQQQDEFLRRVAEVPVTDVYGLVDASGAGAVWTKTSSSWAVVFHFDGWRREAETLQTDTLRVEMPVSEDDLSSLMARIKPYNVLHIRGCVADHPAGRTQALAEEIVSTDVQDDELEARARELQEPIIVEDPRFGALTLDRTVGWFRGRAVWNGRKIELNLAVDDPALLEQLIQAAGELWDAETEWDDRLRDCAVQHLLPIKNESWLDEDETELSAEAFASRLSPDALTIHPDDAFEFWYDDGGLFWGHVIQVTGSLADGPDAAQLYG